MSDALAELEGLLEALPAAVDQQKLGDRLNKVSGTLAGAAQQARRLRAVLQISAAVGFGRSEDQATLVEDLRETALNVADALEQANDEDALRNAEWAYEKELIPELANLDRAVRAQWRALVAERFQTLISFGELLARLDEESGLGERLAACGRAASGLNVTSAEDLAREIQALLAELDALQSERATSVGGDVGLFLDALADRRATLAMITPDVHRWLTEHQAFDRFSVAPL